MLVLIFSYKSMASSFYQPITAPSLAKPTNHAHNISSEMPFNRRPRFCRQQSWCILAIQLVEISNHRTHLCMQFWYSLSGRCLRPSRNIYILLLLLLVIVFTLKQRWLMPKWKVGVERGHPLKLPLWSKKLFQVNIQDLYTTAILLLVCLLQLL